MHGVPQGHASFLYNRLEPQRRKCQTDLKGKKFAHGSCLNRNQIPTFFEAFNFCLHVPEQSISVSRQPCHVTHQMTSATPTSVAGHEALKKSLPWKLNQQHLSGVRLEDPGKKIRERVIYTRLTAVGPQATIPWDMHQKATPLRAPLPSIKLSYEPQDQLERGWSVEVENGSKMLYP